MLSLSIYLHIYCIIYGNRGNPIKKGRIQYLCMDMKKMFKIKIVLELNKYIYYIYSSHLFSIIFKITFSTLSYFLNFYQCLFT